jgi:hypothetical protein
MIRARTLITLVVGSAVLWGAVKAVDKVDAGDLVISPPSQAMPAILHAKLAAVRVVDARPNVPGYDRSCSRGHACVFGPAWTDDHAGFGGHDGCDTRNDILAAQLVDETFKPRTNGCVVLTGKGTDKYTGQAMNFRRTSPLDVQIDHVYPLAAAWDMGASTWTKQRRIDFANDQIRNLLAVSGTANHSKSDKTPSEWIVPGNPAYRCQYLDKYLTVAAAYDLAITRADAAAIKRAAKDCK